MGAYEKYGVSVPIVPVGLNYFRGHKFRGRVVVEYGSPINITKEIFETYKESKRLAYQGLLQQIEEGMRSVIVTASDYSELKLIHTARRLYQRGPTLLTTKAKQDLARRFSTGYKVLREKFGDAIPEDLLELQRNLELYQDKLSYWGLKDYQVINGEMEISYTKLLAVFLHASLVLLLASIPSLLLNFPVGLAANYWSQKEAKKDLKASRVKLAARDVLLSKKILFSIVAVPILWLSYGILLYLFSPLRPKTILVLILSFPIFSYMGVMAVEQGVVDFKDLWPVFLRLLPAFQEQAQLLPKMRSNLQKEVRKMIKKYGPELGPIYYEKTNSWEQAFKKYTQVSDSTDDLIRSPSSDMIRTPSGENQNSLGSPVDKKTA